MESGRVVLGLTAAKVDKNGLTIHQENVLNSLMPGIELRKSLNSTSINLKECLN